MNSRNVLLSICGCVTLVVLLGPTARGGDWSGFPWPYLGNSGYSVYTQETIPYFSKHPPVYYSYPVPRPYGWSPYAYPPGVLTPHDWQPYAPRTIFNPYVPDREKPAAPTSAEKTAQAPKRTINPYVGDSTPTVAGTGPRHQRPVGMVYPVMVDKTN